jgi:glycosyltransferase involved in cell wall biosynthesis
MKGKTLIVSWTLHPWPTGSSVIINNIASQFSKEEMVLFGESYQNNNEHWPKNYPDIHYVDPNITLFGRGQTHLRWLRLNYVRDQITKIIKVENVKRILCVYPDDFYLFAAYSVSKQMNIPLYTWFHNTYYDNVQGYRKLLAKWLQPKVFKHAVKNYVMSEGMHEYFRKSYDSVSFETLVHGFPLPNLPLPSKLERTDRKIKFLFTGNVNESCREASVRLLQTILSKPNYEVHAFSGTTEKAFEGYGVKGENFKVMGFVPLEELYFKQQEYDVMLLPHGFDGMRTKVEYDTIFPTRTIPLLISRRPILSHSPKGVFLTRFLEENKCALNVETKSSEDILSAIDLLLSDNTLVEQLITNALKTSKMFHIKDVAKRLREEFEA